MGVQTRADYTNMPFVLSGNALGKDAQTFLQDAGRGAVALAKYTLCSIVSASGKWVPFTDETATDGTQIPAGIIMAEISGAELVAGDVINVPVLIGNGISIDENQLVIENSKTLTTVITTSDLTVGAELQRQGISTEATVAIDEFEN